MHLYRSDLGGMVNNPSTGDSYVPTTDSAVYLPRVGHHIWNGSVWVDEGYFHESDPRTNLVTYSQDFTDASWAKQNTATLAVDAIGPDGETSAVTLVDSGAGGTGQVDVREANVPTTESTTYTLSFFAKADQLTIASGRLANGFSSTVTSFDLSSGTVVWGLD